MAPGRRGPRTAASVANAAAAHHHIAIAVALATGDHAAFAAVASDAPVDFAGRPFAAVVVAIGPFTIGAVAVAAVAVAAVAIIVPALRERRRRGHQAARGEQQELFHWSILHVTAG